MAKPWMLPLDYWDQARGCSCWCHLFGIVFWVLARGEGHKDPEGRDKTSFACREHLLEPTSASSRSEVASQGARGAIGLCQQEKEASRYLTAEQAQLLKFNCPLKTLSKYGKAAKTMLKAFSQTTENRSVTKCMSPLTLQWVSLTKKKRSLL